MDLSDMPDVAGVTHRGVDIGECRLHLAEAGDGPPLLLLHGWPQHWWSWRHLIEELTQTYRVLAPDLRGWGWSDAPPGDYAKPTFVADIVALLDAEGLDRVKIISHDWGAYTAFLLALDHPERVERLVALDCPPPWPGRLRPRQLGLPALLSYQALVASPRLGPKLMTSSPRFIRGIIRAGSGPGLSWSDSDLDVYAHRLQEPARAQASSACYRTFLTRETPATLRRGDRSAELTVPTLLAMGGKSVLRRVLAPEAGPNLRVETIAGAGHFLPEEAPREVLALAEPFLR